MGAFDRAAAARAKLAQVRREMADRRALRDRNFHQQREQSRDAFKKQGPVMEQVAKHLGELGRRRKQAGGWATEKTERDKDFVMGFGLEDEDQSKNPYNFRATPRPAGASTPPGGIGVIDEEESPLARTSTTPPQAPTPPPAPEAPPAPAPPAPPRAARRPAPRTELDDEDDFSNQSSWMQNR